MEWSDLKIFLAAVRAGSYTAGARQLGINRTTVGRRVEALEAALGVELFKDGPSGHAPTREGEALLASAAAIEDEINTLFGRLRQRETLRAPVRIASSAGIVSEFLQELARFQALDHDTPIELLAELDPVDAVTHRRADLAIAIIRSPPQRLTGVKVGTISQAVYGCRDRAGSRRLGWGHEMDSAIPGQWTVANPAGPAAELDGLPSFNSWPLLKEAVLAGFGTASLWCFAADGEERLEQLEPPDSRFDYPLWLLHRAKSPPGPGLVRLTAFLAESIAPRLQS